MTARVVDLGVALALSLVLAACAQAPGEAPSGSPPAPVRRASPADDWLDVVRVAHDWADEEGTPQDRADAQEALLGIADRPSPSALAPGDALSVRRDLYVRAARLALDRQSYDEAGAIVQRGLALEGSDPFRSQLLLMAVETARARRDPKAELEALRRAREDLGLY